MIAAYLNEAYALGTDLDLNNVFSFVPNEGRNEARGEDAFAFDSDGRVPRIIATHKPWREKFFHGQNVIFLMRSPHDTLLSTYRGIEWRADDAVTFEQFLLEDERGVLSMCQYLNSWAANLRHCNHIAVSYEQLIANAADVMERLLGHLEVPADTRAIHVAVAYAGYDNMKRLNQERGIGGNEGPRSSDDLLRVREGVVGKAKTELSTEQNAMISRILELTLTDEAKQLTAQLTRVTAASPSRV